MAGETKKVCTTEGCEKAVVARGLCRRCYERWRVSGGTGKTCSFEGCEKPVDARGLCKGHYRQQQRGKDLEPLRVPCTFEGCEKPVKAKGLCMGHYRLHLSGEELRPLNPTTKRNKHVEPWPRSATLAERIHLAESVAERTEEGCLVWPTLGRTGVRDGAQGYGLVYDPETKKRWSAHRAAWFVHHGELSTYDMVHHVCGLGRQNACFNIEHLQAVKPHENNAEMVERTAYRRQLLSLRAELDDLRFEVAALEDFLASCGLEAEYAAWCAEQEENDLDPPA